MTAAISTVVGPGDLEWNSAAICSAAATMAELLGISPEYCKVMERLTISAIGLF
jgi:hypothetical protein